MSTLRRSPTLTLALSVLLLALAVWTAGCGEWIAPPPQQTPSPVAVESQAPAARGPGFRSRRALESHFAKHGHEFGAISQSEYLHLAQKLRDAQAGGPILEIVRSADNVTTRFDQDNGHFGAYNADRTIRTYFIPNDGARYFYRQAGRAH